MDAALRLGNNSLWDFFLNRTQLSSLLTYSYTIEKMDKILALTSPEFRLSPAVEFVASHRGTLFLRRLLVNATNT